MQTRFECGRPAAAGHLLHPDARRHAGSAQYSVRSSAWFYRCCRGLRQDRRSSSELKILRLLRSRSQPRRLGSGYRVQRRPAGRAWLLLLIYPPHREAEWRCSSGGWRAAPLDAVEDIVWRSKRSRPESMPPDGHRNEGTRAQRGPYAGASVFWLLFLAFEKK